MGRKCICTYAQHIQSEKEGDLVIQHFVQMTGCCATERSKELWNLGTRNAVVNNMHVSDRQNVIPIQ